LTFGLQVGDLIVAFDGTQVENNEQYTLVDSSTTDSSMRWIVWRDHRYHEISAWGPERNWRPACGPTSRPPRRSNKEGTTTGPESPVLFSASLAA
jgi:hypothetical protein